MLERLDEKPSMASGPWVPAPDRGPGQALRGNDGVASSLLLGVEDLEGEEGGDYEVGDVD